MMLSFFACNLSKSTLFTVTSTPYSDASFVWRYISAYRRKGFVGRHPRYKQVPPKFSRSTTATCIPSCAARIAATYPPVPPPKTTRSYSFDIVSVPFFSKFVTHKLLLLLRFV